MNENALLYLLLVWEGEEHIYKKVQAYRAHISSAVHKMSNQNKIIKTHLKARIALQGRGKWGKTYLPDKTDHRPSGPDFNCNVLHSSIGSFVFVHNICAGQMKVPACTISELF